MQEKGLEPSGYCYHTDLNRARLPIPPFLQWCKKVVDGDGFEPSKSTTTDLQSAPFGRSGTHPRNVCGTDDSVFKETLELVMGLEPATC